MDMNNVKLISYLEDSISSIFQPDSDYLLDIALAVGKCFGRIAGSCGPISHDGVAWHQSGGSETISFLARLHRVPFAGQVNADDA